MHKRRRLVAYGLILTGIMVVGALALTINRGPLVSGFRPYKFESDISKYCLWCRQERLMGAWDILGMALIILLMMTIPLAHLALLIMAATWLNRPGTATRTHRALCCPYCGARTHVGARVCGTCGRPYSAPEAADSSPSA